MFAKEHIEACDGEKFLPGGFRGVLAMDIVTFLSRNSLAAGWNIRNAPWCISPAARSAIQPYVKLFYVVFAYQDLHLLAARTSLFSF